MTCLPAWLAGDYLNISFLISHITVSLAGLGWAGLGGSKTAFKWWEGKKNRGQHHRVPGGVKQSLAVCARARISRILQPPPPKFNASVPTGAWCRGRDAVGVTPWAWLPGRGRGLVNAGRVTPTASRLIMTVSREPQNHQQKSLLGQAFVDPTETLTRLGGWKSQLGGDTELPPSLLYFTTKLEEKKIVCVL